MIIAITGAGGFLGQYILKSVDKSKNMVYALTSKTEKVISTFNGQYGIKPINKEKYTEIPWKSVDVLINCAYPRGEGGVLIADGLTYIQNVMMNAVNEGVKAVINVSSQSVYNQRRNEAASEYTALDLETKYAIGKYATELLTNSICQEIRHTNIRMASLIGPEFEQRLVNKFVKQALDGNDLNIQGTQQFFGFMDVEDAANAILRVAEDEGEWNEVYNLGIKGTYSIIELAEKVKEIVNKEISINIIEKDVWFNSEVEAKRFYERFDFLPQVTIEQTIKNILEYLD